jgi:hypothetical protein
MAELEVDDTYDAGDTTPPADEYAFDAWARDRVVRLATDVVGLGNRNGTRDAYRELIADGELMHIASALARDSGCGLTVRGIWRRFGLNDPRLRATYRLGSVMSTIADMAHEAGAWPQGFVLPQEGDVLFYGEPEHVGIVVRVLEPAGGSALALVHTVDGGQRDAQGLQKILARQRALRSIGGHIVATSPDDANTEQHRVQAVLDFAKIARRFAPRGNEDVYP